MCATRVAWTSGLVAVLMVGAMLPVQSLPMASAADKTEKVDKKALTKEEKAALKAKSAEKRAEREKDKPAAFKPPAVPAKPDAFPILMPANTPEQALLKLVNLEARYRLPGEEEEVTAGARRHASATLSAMIALCKDFDDKWPEHPGREWVLAFQSQSLIRLSEISDAATARAGGGEARRIIESYLIAKAAEAGMNTSTQAYRRHPLYEMTQLHQNARQYARDLGSIGNFRDSSLAKRNQVVTAMLRFNTTHPDMPGQADLLLEFGRMFYLAEIPGMAGTLLSRVTKNYPNTYPAVEAAKLLDKVNRMTKPVDFAFTDAVDRKFDLASHRGHVTVLMFANPTEPGSENFMEKLQALLEQYGKSDGLHVVTVSQATSPTEWKELNLRTGRGWTHLLDHADDGKSAAGSFGVVRFPSFVLIDHLGRQKLMFDGSNLDTEVYHLISVQRSMAER